MSSCLDIADTVASTYITADQWSVQYLEAAVCFVTENMNSKKLTYREQSEVF